MSAGKPAETGTLDAVRAIIRSRGYDPRDFTIEELESTPDHPAGFTVFHPKSGYQRDYIAEENETAVSIFANALDRGDYPKK
jgi:hypothetical protein